jgi:hypothetical protein
VRVKACHETATIGIRGFLLSRGKLQVIEVHVPLIDNTQRQHIYALRQMNLGDIFHFVPVMPLPPGKGIGGIERRLDGKRISQLLPVQIEGNGPAAI